LARRARTNEYFKDFDRLRTGYITKAQFDRCLDQHYGIVLNPVEDSVLMRKYGHDRHHPGMVRYRDFCNIIDAVFDPTNFSQPPETQQLPPADPFIARPISPASKAKVENLLQRIAPYYKYHGINIKTSYEDFDRHNIGLVTESQFYRQFPGPPDVSEQEQMLLASKYFHPTKSGLINYIIFHQDVENIIKAANIAASIGGEDRPSTSAGRRSRKGTTIEEIFDKIRVAVHKNGIRTTEFFKDHDKLRSGVITKNQFVCGLTLCCGTQANLSREEIDLVVQHHSTEDGRVRYKEFCDAMEHAFSVPNLEKKPTQDIYRPPVGYLAEVPNDLSESDEIRVAKILRDLQETVRRKRLMLYPYFKDFDRGNCYTRGITKTQFSRMLHMVGLEMTESDLEVICRKFEYKDSGDVNYPAFIQAIDMEYTATADLKEISGQTMLDNEKKEECTVDTSSVDVFELISRIRHHVLVNRIRVEEYFQDFDPLRHGSISIARFRMGLSAMGQENLTDPQFYALVEVYADRKRRGNVMWTSFLTDVEKVFTERGLEKRPQTKLQPQETFLMPKTGTTANLDEDLVPLFNNAMTRMRQKTDQRRILMKPCFQDFDRHNHGYVTNSQFRQCISYLNLEASMEEMDVIFKKFSDKVGFNYLKFLEQLHPSKGHELKYTKRLEEIRATQTKAPTPTAVADINAVMLKIKTKIVKSSVRVYEYMKDYDKLRTGRMLKTIFPRSLDLCRLELAPSEVQAIMDAYTSVGHPDYVDYYAFCDEIETVFTRKGLEKNPTLKVEQFKPKYNTTPKSLSPDAEETVKAVLLRLADRVRLRRIQLFPLFEDYDRVHNCTVSRSQFHRVLSELELVGLVSEREFQTLYDKFDAVIGGKHDFDYVDFCHQVNAYAKFETRKP